MKENMEKRMENLESKLDFIVSELKVQKQKREEFEEFKEDMNRIIKTIFNTITEELEDVSENLKTGSFLFFGKKIIRNLNNISKLVDQLESVEDFVKDFSLLTKIISNDIMLKLEELEKKGYFEFLRNLLKITDKVIENFKSQDMENISGLITDMSDVIKNLLTEENLKFLRAFLVSYKNTIVPEKISTIKLLKEINSLNNRKLIYRLVLAMKNS